MIGSERKARENKMNTRLFTRASRLLMSSAAALILVAAASTKSFAANDTTIQICIDRAGHISGIDTNCRRNQTALNWNIPGPQGAQGVQGPTGPTGVMGPQGVTGNQGGVGPLGPIGPTGAKGNPGSQGPQGVTGLAGPTGNVGPTGPQGPAGLAGQTGSAGHLGVDGSNETVLGGGNLGTFLASDYGTHIVGNETLYFGPDNGASFNLASVSVPMPAGTLIEFTVQLTDDLNTGTVTFTGCVNGLCDPKFLSCTITSGPPDNCEVEGSVPLNNGDAFAIQATVSGATGNGGGVDLSWSTDYVATPLAETDNRLQ